MPVIEILLLRHGHREPWTLNPATGEYLSATPFPSGLPADPPLAPVGAEQAQEAGHHLATYLSERAKLGRLRIFSSPFYRCLETLQPLVSALEENGSSITVQTETGLGEWFPRAWFVVPKPAEAARMRRDFFSWIDDKYQSKITPPDHGERIMGLHGRVEATMGRLIHTIDQETPSQDVTLLICSHAALIIAAARALTGALPKEYGGEFKCFTAGISKFIRKEPTSISGNWNCILNSDCSHLSKGEQNGWQFCGDEDYETYEAACRLGIKIANGSAKLN